MSMIKLSDALRLIEAHDERGEPIPFSMKWVTHNRSNKTGGKFKSVNRAVISGAEKSANPQKFKHQWRKEKKNPMHSKNATRNIKCLDSKKIYKVNIWLIIRVKGQKVVL